ncbi:MAG: hypothetical protein KME15_13675 [Drouetiella hepatica Uher 2000/2452]|jgi:hypothetical protein|uniref:Uncharacterized protein n=1 Tax=Drouetiella hepatica Uher 2000/2452 TaxID=904376 RepID=A0A951UMJ4_9CYAN|nr:hypothetical protein [Drouetiella hepatica Uher 2000/2452]
MTSITLNQETFISLLQQEFESLSIPHAPVRRRGAENGAGISSASGAIEGVFELLTDGVIDRKEALTELAEAAIEIASSLYASGAEHQVWRRWSAIAAFGLFLTDQIYQSILYTILAEEWEFLRIIPLTGDVSKQISAQVIWLLVGGHLMSELPKTGRHSERKAWLKLAQSIPAGQHDVTEAALKDIADFWMAELEDSWMNYEPGDYPDFNPEACAVVALARHNGFVPTSFTSEQYRFLEAGLAISEPPSLYSTIFLC